MSKEQHTKTNNQKLKKIIIIVLSILLVLSVVSVIILKVFENKDTEIQQEISQVLDTIEKEKQITERMEQVKELKKENEDIIGWLEIKDTNINYPILQGTDNEYYLTHNYKKEKVTGGSLFLDKNYDFSIPSSNLLIYGHRNKKGIMFEDLLKYKDEEFYKEHSKIRFTTTEDDSEYEIISVFYSRVYYQDEKDVFRYYYFINAENEEEYNEYINNAKKVSIYDTGKIAEYGEQLLTLSTCEYSQANGRFVIVAKKES